ncbi:NAD(P)H-quinone oxidoreductase subunit U like [Actinidia chinensis var. chinensis]|uniref:NAD(P)H-quinone oxidoreductase subunit U like n=1 Tax=Actinidia chinensis var. chinensis TaxID=1590841 RepID=A0A2R6PMR3_ACTCC|nr:NAD(P)H-quinone oxidoreductase subunit U like [Actinidia chinensis var. chinensis]
MAATSYISHPHNFLTSRCAFSHSHSHSHSITFPTTTTKPRKYQIRSTGDASEETTATDTQETSVELPKGPPSLISTLNVERALRGIPITDVDYYGSLGIQKGCSSDQVYVAYKSKVEELINDKLEEEELSKRLEVLKESYSVLSSADERRLYDWSLARSENPDTYLWPFEVDNSKKSTEPPPPQEPEDVRPTRLVGYFMLGWLVLSFTLSIILNR